MNWGLPYKRWLSDPIVSTATGGVSTGACPSPGHYPALVLRALPRAGALSKCTEMRGGRGACLVYVGVAQRNVVVRGDDVAERGQACRTGSPSGRAERVRARALAATTRKGIVRAAHARRCAGPRPRRAGSCAGGPALGRWSCSAAASRSCSLRARRAPVSQPARAGEVVRARGRAHMARTHDHPPDDPRPCDRAAHDGNRLGKLALKDAVEVLRASDRDQGVLVGQAAEDADVSAVLKAAASGHGAGAARLGGLGRDCRTVAATLAGQTSKLRLGAIRRGPRPSGERESLLKYM
jgi:hypothetical protein